MRPLNIAIGATALIGIVAGCHAPESIPTYSPRSSGESFALIHQRASQVRDITGQGQITLSGASGSSVILDAAFVFAPPDRARVRAWKFGQAVLDLTITPDGDWLFLARQDEHANQLRATSADAGRAVREWLALLSDGIDRDASSVDTKDDQIVVTRPMPDGATVACTIDRKTLTPRHYGMTDRNGSTRFTLDMSAYTVAGPTVWPKRITATSPTGTIQIDLREIDVNVAPLAAFKHPARAERLP